MFSTELSPRKSSRLSFRVCHLLLSSGFSSCVFIWVCHLCLLARGLNRNCHLGLSCGLSSGFSSGVVIWGSLCVVILVVIWSCHLSCRCCTLVWPFKMLFERSSDVVIRIFHLCLPAGGINQWLSSEVVMWIVI
jgi:hypothetical protein